MTPALNLEQVSVSHCARRVLADITFNVVSGELCCLVGPNGAGKSTLVSAIAGSQILSSGVISLLGEPIEHMSKVEQAKRRAVLPQEHTIGFKFTCAEVVQMARHAWANTDRNREDEKYISDAMNICDVGGLSRRSFSSLSGGERGRVALARVLAQGTPILLLDEPTTAMDPHYQEHVMATIRRQVDAGAAALVVVHDLNLASAFADKVAILAPDEEGCGRIVDVGEPRATLTAERLSEVYGLAMSTHTIEGQHVVLPSRR